MLLVFASACGSDDAAGPSSGGSSGSGATAGASGSGGTAGSSGGAAGVGASSGIGGGSAGTAGSGASAGTAGTAGASNFVPYFDDDFESYADGASLSGYKPFDAAGRTVATTAAAVSGKQSAKMEIKSTDGGGFGKWGGVIAIKPALGAGKEIWVRLYVMWPASFQFTAFPFMKFLRLHDQEAGGTNGGYNDLYVNNANGTTKVLQTIKEKHDKWAYYDGPSLPRDKWERYEMYLAIDDKSVDDGGGGRVRIWRDDTLIFDRTDVPTLSGTGGTINSFYLFTYWNFGNGTTTKPVPDNYCYVDDLAIATSASPPPNKDSAGNAYIGKW